MPLSCVALESVGSCVVGGARQFKGSRGGRAPEPGAGPAYPRGDSGRGRLVPRGAGESARLALARRIALTWSALGCELIKIRGGHGIGHCQVGRLLLISAFGKAHCDTHVSRVVCHADFFGFKRKTFKVECA